MTHSIPPTAGLLLSAALVLGACGALDPVDVEPDTAAKDSVIGDGREVLRCCGGSGWVRQAKLTASDGVANQGFGSSVAIDGNTMVVGAPLADASGNDQQGAAYLLARVGDTWTHMTKLTVSDGGFGDHFGESVAIDGNTVVVSGQGGAYVFKRSSCYVPIPCSGTYWTQTAKLTPSNGNGLLYPMSVAIDGNTVVVAGAGAGPAHVFTEASDIWTGTATLTAPGTPNDAASVAIEGNTVVVGGLGGANVFKRFSCAGSIPCSGTHWTQTAQLSAGVGGASVAIDSNTVVVGVPPGFNQAKAYVFRQDGGAWMQDVVLASAYEGYSVSVAVAGNRIVMGSSEEVDAPSPAYIFTRSGSTWTEKLLNASDGAAFEEFGKSVATDGNTVVVGAPHDDTEPDVVYVFVWKSGLPPGDHLPAVSDLANRRRN